MKSDAVKFKTNPVQVPDAEANGTTIRLYRQGSAMPLRVLAGALGISKSYLYDMERGSRSMSEEIFSRAKAVIQQHRDTARPT